jgi:hypothetical protein
MGTDLVAVLFGLQEQQALFLEDAAQGDTIFRPGHVVMYIEPILSSN